MGFHSVEVELPNVTKKFLDHVRTEFKAKIISVKDATRMFTNILFFIKFPVKIHSFEVESLHVTNNFLIC